MGIMSGKYQPGAACQMRLIHVPSVSVSVQFVGCEPSGVHEHNTKEEKHEQWS